MPCLVYGLFLVLEGEDVKGLCRYILPKHISLFFYESVHDEFVIDRFVYIFVQAFLAFHITSKVAPP